jgi:hypothetical protein
LGNEESDIVKIKLQYDENHNGEIRMKERDKEVRKIINELVGIFPLPKKSFLIILKMQRAWLKKDIQVIRKCVSLSINEPFSKKTLYL